jgi:hypothetical protein
MLLSEQGARAQVVAPQLFHGFLVTVNNPVTRLSSAALTVPMERRISGKFVFAFHGIPPLRDQYSDYRGKSF